VAVKKATAKKSAAKKAAPKKKSAVKKSPAKKSAAKKAKKKVVKKSVVKKSTARKAAPKKKSTVKKVAKRATKRTAQGIDKFVVPAVPLGGGSRSSNVSVSSTPSRPAPAAAKPAPVKKDGLSKGVIYAVVVGVVILLAIVVGKGGSKNDDAAPMPLPTATDSVAATPEPMVSESPTEAAPVAVATVEGPTGIVAQYTATGATIFWKAPTAVDGLSGYSIEASVSAGPWKMLSTVGADQFSFDVTKGDSTGNTWTSFKVSSVYSDGQTAAGKVFGLPGLFS